MRVLERGCSLALETLKQTSKREGQDLNRAANNTPSSRANASYKANASLKARILVRGKRIEVNSVNSSSSSNTQHLDIALEFR